MTDKGKFAKEQIEDLIWQVNQEYDMLEENLSCIMLTCINDMMIMYLDDEMENVLSGAVNPTPRFQAVVDKVMPKFRQAIDEISHQVKTNFKPNDECIKEAVSRYLGSVCGREFQFKEKFRVTYIDSISKMLVNPPAWSKYHHDK